MVDLAWKARQAQSLEQRVEALERQVMVLTGTVGTLASEFHAEVNDPEKLLARLLALIHHIDQAHLPQ